MMRVMASGRAEWEKKDEAEVLRRFGKESLRPGQDELIQRAVEGKSVLGLLPTGYGKSLCYQAAALLRGGTSVVVSPLLALMREQVEYMCSIGARAARYDSTLAPEERETLLAELAAGNLQLLYVAPESLESPVLNEALSHAPLQIFVVDEAHCISQWGHSFRPDYLRLPVWAAEKHFVCTMAFTATATPRVREELCRAFGISDSCVVEISPYRANILRRVICSDSPEEVLSQYLSVPYNRPCIVYTRTRKKAEELAAAMTKQWGIPAACYHAGLPTELREKLQDAFLDNKPDVLVATIAFGMGIDKPDVRSVVHVNMPASPEAYLQESGRAGRDGLPATSLVLLSGTDRVSAHNRVHAAMPDAEGILRCVRWLLPTAPRVVSLWELGVTCDVAEDVPQRVLELLVARKAVHVESQGYKYYKVRPLYALTDILRGRDVQECTRLRWLDGHRDGEVEDVATAWNCSFAEAVEQLTECERAGEWKLTFRQRALCIVPGEKDVNSDAVADELNALYAARRDADLERLAVLEEMLSAPTCLNSALEAYFTGRSLRAPCGHCSACRGEVPALPPVPAAQELPVDADLPAFDRDAQRRRFLAGISSPASLARRLYAHPLYGSLANTPWEVI